MTAASLAAAINRHSAVLVAALLLVSFAARILRIEAPPIPIFDEGLFYIPAARAYLAGLPDPNPEHPPLGKLLFAAGMALFGDTPMGWRIMSSIVGTAGIGLTFLLGARLWGSAAAGLVAATLLAFDLLWFLFSRLIMYDVFLATLVLAGLTLAWRHRETGGSAALAGAGLAIGLAAAVKWAGLWALAPALLACAFAPRRWTVADVGRRGALLGSGVVAGYLIPWTYHIATLGYGPAELVQQHVEMLQYHVALRASADPSAQWTTPLRWLLNEPLIFTSRDDRSIWVPALANPLLFWGGLAAAAWCGCQMLAGKGLRERLAGPHAFLAVWVLAFYLPWFAFPRIKYFYYLLPLLPALALALTGGLHALLQPPAGPRRRLAVAGYAMGLVAVALGMYPAVTGMLSGAR